MLRGRPAVVSVFLWFVSLPVLMHTRSLSHMFCGEDTIKLVKNISKTAQTKQNQMDSRLYTPTLQDYANCPASTLDCFSQESSVLLQEWNETNNQLPRDLQRLTRRINKTVQSTCSRACELHTQEAAQTFLASLHEVLENMNSQYCSDTKS